MPDPNMTPIHEMDWKKAKGMRDIITHHYFDIDAETVFVVCSEHVPVMKKVIQKVLNDLEKGSKGRGASHR